MNMLPRRILLRPILLALVTCLATAAVLWALAGRASAQGSGAYSFGLVMPADAAAPWAIRPVWHLAGLTTFDPEPPLSRADGRVIFYDAAGAIVASRLVARDETCDPTCTESDHTFVVIPALPTATRAELHRVDATGQAIELKAWRDRSTGIPAVAILRPGAGDALTTGVPIDWLGADADGDALTYDVLLRPSSGSYAQIPLRIETNATHFVFDATGIAADDDATLVIVANDGFNTTEETVTGLRIGGNRAPQIYIVSPADLTTVAPGSAVPLLAVATDAEDGSLAVQWQSNLDGAIAGSTWRPRTLGQHILTASVQDSAGFTASAQVRVMVDELVPTALPPGGTATPDTPGGTGGAKVFLPSLWKRWTR